MNTRTKPNVKLKPLSLARQSELQSYWDQKLRDSHAFVPIAKRKELTATEIRKGNVLFGKFASSYLKWVIGRITCGTDVVRRQNEEKKIMAVGYGRGFDSRWLKKATNAGLETWWVDVSSLAWIWARTDLDKQFQEMQTTNKTIGLKPEVKIFEIQSLLADPSKAELDLGSIEIWYLSRLLNCLSTSSAKVVLQEIGRTALGSISDRSKHNAVVVLNALSDHNSTCTCGGTSIIRSKKMILSNLSYGAGCPVESRFIKYYDYFGKLVTAMTVMVK